MTAPVAQTYRRRLWWIPATIVAVAAVSLVQTVLELTLLDVGNLDLSVSVLLPAHLIAAAISIVLFTTVRVIRGNAPTSLNYSERYLVGLGYGIVTALLICVAAAALGAESFGQAVEYSGVFMTASLFSLELPVACVVGGLVWHLLTKVPAGTPAPARRRRAIEDPE